MINKIVSILNGWKTLTNAVESILVDNIAATAPWLAPLVPAYMVHQAMIFILGFPSWIAWAGAAVVEFLGLAAIQTTFTFWDYNEAKRQSDQNAPVKVALATSAFYMAVILTVNVMLDDSTLLLRVAKALLSLLSIIAAVILALRSQHARRLQSIRDEKEERKKAKVTQVTTYQNLPQLSSNLPNLPDNSPNQDWRTISDDDRLKIAGMGVRQIRETYGVTSRTALNWKKNARREVYEQ